jgi:hypothetical protein
MFATRKATAQIFRNGIDGRDQKLFCPGQILAFGSVSNKLADIIIFVNALFTGVVTARIEHRPAKPVQIRQDSLINS